MKQKNKHVKLRHKVIQGMLKGIVCGIVRSLFHVKIVNKYKLAKDEKVFILSNHQTDLDPFFITPLFNKPIYYVATDTLASSSAFGFIDFVIHPIAKKKGEPDYSTIKKILETNAEGGSICLFPEGNRPYAEFQFPIEEATARLVKKLGSTIILVNIKGGTGVSPRFGYKRRKGPASVGIERVIKPEEYSNMSDAELCQIIRDTLRVYDSESGNLYKSARRGEYLEREFFICPSCGGVQTLVSSKAEVECTCCHAKAEFTEDLHLKPLTPTFPYTRFLEWYNYQKDWVRNLEVKPDETIFTDDNVKLFEIRGHKRKLLAKGKMKITDKELTFGGLVSLELRNLTVSSPVSGIKLAMTFGDKSYLVVGDKRFNPLKYSLIFNKLETALKHRGTDIYFGLK